MTITPITSAFEGEPLADPSEFGSAVGGFWYYELEISTLSDSDLLDSFLCISGRPTHLMGMVDF